MFKLLKQLGCLTIIIILGLVIYSFYDAAERSAPSGRTNTQAAATDDPRPLPEVVSMMFAKGCREYMNDPDSYKPGAIRTGDHPEGFAYIHEFRGKNAFGAMIKDMCGLLYATNKSTRAHAWTFYNRDELPELLKDVTVNGKRLTDASGSAPAAEAPKPATEAPKPKIEAPKPTPVHEPCSMCGGKGKVPKTASCPKCAGAGKIYVNGKWKSCPKTVTTGDRPCSACNGSGTVEVLR